MQGKPRQDRYLMVLHAARVQFLDHVRQKLPRRRRPRVVVHYHDYVAFSAGETRKPLGAYGVRQRIAHPVRPKCRRVRDRRIVDLPGVGELDLFGPVVKRNLKSRHVVPLLHVGYRPAKV